MSRSVRTFLPSLTTVLWMATTPLALTLLGASPARGSAETTMEARADQAGHEVEGHAPESHGAGHGEAGSGEHHLLENPIQNLTDFGYAKKDVHGGSLEPGEEKLPPPFAAALLNFGVLAFIIGKFAAPSIARMTRERHDTIAKQLAESTQLRDEARAKLAEYQRKVDGLQGEIDKLVAGIRADAEAEKARIIAEADARATRIEKDAELQVQAEILRITATLERETVQQAVAIAEQLLRDRIEDGDRQKLADRFATELGSRRTLV